MESKWRFNWWDKGLYGLVPFQGFNAPGRGLLARKLVGIGAGVYYVGPVTSYGSAYWFDPLNTGLVVPVPIYDPPQEPHFPFGYVVEPDPY